RGTHARAVELAVGAAAAALVRVVRMLDLDHVGAQHGKLISGERTRQHMRHVDDANAFKGAGHGRLLLGTGPGAGGSAIAPSCHRGGIAAKVLAAAAGSGIMKPQLVGASLRKDGGRTRAWIACAVAAAFAFVLCRAEIAV